MTYYNYHLDKKDNEKIDKILYPITYEDITKCLMNLASYLFDDLFEAKILKKGSEKNER